MWLLVATPYVLLSATLLFGLGSLARHDRRREIVIALLGLVWVFNVLGVVVLVVSLVFHSAVHITGRQLLFSGAAAWLTDAIAFGLAFWELDSGGPVARAVSTVPRKPDFQFPQDENAQLAREGWAPRLWDYFYVSLTNATALRLRRMERVAGIRIATPRSCMNRPPHVPGEGVDGSVGGPTCVMPPARIELAHAV